MANSSPAGPIFNYFTLVKSAVTPRTLSSNVSPTAESVVLQWRGMWCYPGNGLCAFYHHGDRKGLRLDPVIHFHWLITTAVMRQVDKGCYTVQRLKNSLQLQKVVSWKQTFSIKSVIIRFLKNVCSN